MLGPQWSWKFGGTGRLVQAAVACRGVLLNRHSRFAKCSLDVATWLVESVLLSVLQFSGENAERLKKIYGKFCGQHNQSVNYFKDLYTKDKRFQAFVKVRGWAMPVPVSTPVSARAICQEQTS